MACYCFDEDIRYFQPWPEGLGMTIHLYHISRYSVRIYIGMVKIGRAALVPGWGYPSVWTLGSGGRLSPTQSPGRDGWRHHAGISPLPLFPLSGFLGILFSCPTPQPNKPLWDAIRHPLVSFCLPPSFFSVSFVFSPHTCSRRTAGRQRANFGPTYPQ